MSQRLIAVACLALCWAWLGATPARGQRSPWATIDRASTRSASARMGRTGGFYTRQYGAPRPYGGYSIGGMPGRGLSQPNYMGARPARLPAPAVPMAFTMAEVGYAGHSAPGSPYGGADRAILYASRLQASFGLSVPLTGLGTTVPNFPNRPYYVPEPGETALHRFFNLEPTEAQAEPEPAIPEDGLVGILEQQNERMLRGMAARALATFKRATTRDAANRVEDLARAQQQLIALRDLDRHQYLPCLLLIHVALERGQLLQALRYMDEMIRREPAVFIERPDIASFFGDPELLEEQMRENLQVGEANPGRPAAYLLQAYCAWVLNDRVRIERALELMRQADPEIEMLERVRRARFALSAAIK